MNTSLVFLCFSRNISVILVWEGLDVAGDIVAVQWVPRATESNWYANSIYLCDPVHKTYAKKWFLCIYRPVARICIRGVFCKILDDHTH